MRVRASVRARVSVRVRVSVRARVSVRVRVRVRVKVRVRVRVRVRVKKHFENLVNNCHMYVIMKIAMALTAMRRPWYWLLVERRRTYGEDSRSQLRLEQRSNSSLYAYN